MQRFTLWGVLIGILCCLLSTAFAADSAIIRPDDYQGIIRIACVGDSITEGGHNYPTYLAKLLGDKFNIGNFGLSGTTVMKNSDFTYWNKPQYVQAAEFNPQVVIIKLGTNDSKPQNWKNKDQFAVDYRALIDHFLQLPSKPKVYVCLPVPAYIDNFGINGTVIEKEICPLIKQVAKEANVPVIDLHTALSGHPEFFFDGIHPNTDGATLIAQTIYQYLTGAPIINPAGDQFSDKAAVTMSTLAADATIRYTLDGSEPTNKSPEYKKPLSLTNSTTVKAASFFADGKSSPVNAVVFTKLVPRNPDKPGATAKGLAYNYYENDDPKALVDMEQLTPAAMGITATVNLDMRKRDANFAVTYTGYIAVPTDGAYTFYTTSDDGSFLFIGDAKVVDNDGMHGTQERKGKIALKAGMHAVKITFYQGAGGAILNASYEGPGIAKQEIPANAFSHAEEN